MIRRASAIAALVGAFALVIAALGPRDVSAAGRLPQEIVQTLVGLNGELGQRAKLTQQWRDELDEQEARLHSLRDLAASDAQLQSAKTGGLIVLAIDGMEIARTALRGEAELQRQELEILSGVAAGLVHGEGYLDLDEALLVIERGQSERESSIRGLRDHLDKVDAVISTTEGEPGGSTAQKIVQVTRLAFNSLRLSEDQLDRNYEQVIVPGTASLRHIVDLVPQR